MRILDRAWPRRGYASPPHFGRLLPPLWTETSVTFLRSSPTDDGHGGFTAGILERYLTVQAHVEFSAAAEPAGPYALDLGVVQRRLIRAFFNPPALALMPKKGDFLEFTDALGQGYRLSIRVVTTALDLGETVTVETEEFE